MSTPRGRARWGVSVLLLVLLAAGVGGCGGGPVPRAWATSVCQALAPWRAEIGTLANRTQQQMTAETTPAQARENLVRLFGGARTASEQARAAVERAGVPDVEGGDAVARGFVQALGAMRDAYGRAADNIERLDTGDAKAFYTEVGKVVETLNVEYRDSGLDTSRLNSPELQQAFDEVPECR